MHLYKGPSRLQGPRRGPAEKSYRRVLESASIVIGSQMPPGASTGCQALIYDSFQVISYAKILLMLQFQLRQHFDP
jgi:hypothetical protein